MDENKKKSELSEEEEELVNKFIKRRSNQSEKEYKQVVTKTMQNLLTSTVVDFEGEEISFAELIAAKYVNSLMSKEFLDSKDMLALQELTGEKKVVNEAPVLQIDNLILQTNAIEESTHAVVGTEYKEVVEVKGEDEDND